MTGARGAQGLLNAALVGSSRAVVNEALPAATPEGGLVGLLSDANAEQRLLLAAGARAIYRLAGYTPERVEAPLEPAPPETKTTCSPTITALMDELLLADDVSLQAAALKRMIAVGLLMPPETLPRLLEEERNVFRAQVAQVAGERGAWLARFNRDWQWVRDELPSQIEDIAASAETIWRDGSPADRLQALAYWRATDPVRARDEVAAVWRREKADFRVRMLTALIPTWNDALTTDEPLLEMALDDRSANIANLAQRTLARVPGSAYSQRARARADAFLSMGRKKLTVTLPEAYEKSWERDGIERKPRQGMEESAWLLMRILAVTPPAHWVERFGRSPIELLTAIPDNRFLAVAEGWAEAAVRYQAAEWAPAFIELLRKRSDRHDELASLIGQTAILLLLPREELEAIALRILRQGETKDTPSWISVAAVVSRPWSVEVARAWIAALREHASDLKAEKQPYHELLMVRGDRALKLPRICLDEALAPWDIETTTMTTEAIWWRERLDAFLKTLRLCQRIYDEIPRE